MRIPNFFRTLQSPAVINGNDAFLEKMAALRVGQLIVELAGADKQAAVEAALELQAAQLLLHENCNANERNTDELYTKGYGGKRVLKMFSKAQVVAKLKEKGLTDQEIEIGIDNRRIRVKEGSINLDGVSGVGDILISQDAGLRDENDNPIPPIDRAVKNAALSIQAGARVMLSVSNTPRAVDFHPPKPHDNDPTFMKLAQRALLDIQAGTHSPAAQTTVALQALNAGRITLESLNFDKMSASIKNIIEAANNGHATPAAPKNKKPLWQRLSGNAPGTR